MMARLMRRFAGLHLAIGQGYGDGNDTHLCDTFFGFDTDFFRRGRREIDDSTFDVRTAIFDFHHGALAGFHVGYLGRRSQGQRIACRIIRLGLHGSSVSHLVAGEALCIDRRFPDSLVAGGVGRQLFGFIFVRRDNLLFVRAGRGWCGVGLEWLVRNGGKCAREENHPKG